MSGNNGACDVYKPNRWCVGEHIIVYDIVKSKNNKKIYIIFNTLIHFLKKTQRQLQHLNKRERNYLRLFRKLCGIDNKDIDPPFTVVTGKQIPIECKWITTNIDRYQFVYVMRYKNKINNKLKVTVELGKLKKPIHCTFTGLYRQTGNLAAILLFKNENDFLDTWIEHHIKLGVDTFFIYNNNPGNKDNQSGLIKFGFTSLTSGMGT